PRPDSAYAAAGSGAMRASIRGATSLLRRLRLRRPGRHDVPALVAGIALLGCAASALGAWGTAACVLGVLAAAASPARWPATVAASAVVAAVAYDVAEWWRLLAVGLLTAAYLVLLSGVPALDGLAALAAGVGVGVATLVAA